MRQRRLLLPAWSGTLVVFLASIALVGIAQAAPPLVKTVPWVASNPLIPHDIFNGEQTTLKGATDIQGAGIQYVWDFGDGSPVATGMDVLAAIFAISLKFSGGQGSSSHKGSYFSTRLAKRIAHAGVICPWVPMRISALLPTASRTF